MKNQILLVFAIIIMIMYACTGKRADGKDEGKDTSYMHADTSNHTVKDTVGKKDPDQDSTSNAPRMPVK